MRAGFIPYFKDNNEIHIMLMIPSDPAYGGNCPQICKGFAEESETYSDAAIREAEEELGLKRENIKSIHYFKTIKNIAIYYGEIIDKNDFNQFHYETGETLWIDEKNIGDVRDWQQSIVKDFFKLLTEK